MPGIVLQIKVIKRDVENFRLHEKKTEQWMEHIVGKQNYFF